MFSEPERATVSKRVCHVLQDFATAFERREPHGVSISDMHRALDISHAEMSRIVKGDHKLGVEQALRLPTRVRRAVMAVLTEESDALDARASSRLSPEVRARRYAKLVGEHNALLDDALLDGVIDRAEHARLRASSQRLEAEAAAGATDGEGVQ